MSEPRGYITEDDVAEGAGFKRPERDVYTPHNHRERVDGCFRCDLSGDES